MAVTSVLNRFSFVANGATTAFAFNAAFQTQADLVVLLVNTTTGVQTTMNLGSDYTISGTQDSNGAYPNGGTVNFGVAPASGNNVIIYRDPARTQTVVHVDGDALPAASIDSPLDKLTLIAQRHDDLLNRSLRQPDGDASNILALPPVVTRQGSGAGSYFGFDANGNPTVFTIANGGTSVPISTAMTPVVEAASLAAARQALAGNKTLDDIATAAWAQGDVMYFNGTDLVRLAAGTAGQFLTTEGAGANPKWTGALPQVTVLTSGSGTYNTPANAVRLRVRMVGGGGGGGGNGSAASLNGGNGGDTTFGTFTAGHGSGGNAINGTASVGGGGAGGVTAGSPTFGAPGGNGGAGGASLAGGGPGGASIFGPTFIQGTGNGTAAAANTGAGGAGAAFISGTATGAGGGGAGAFAELFISNPNASYAYAVGAGGTAGTAGTGGNAGGAGGSGLIIVEAYFQ